MTRDRLPAPSNQPEVRRLEDTLVHLCDKSQSLISSLHGWVMESN